jgi:hypothetical protein
MWIGLVTVLQAATRSEPLSLRAAAAVSSARPQSAPLAAVFHFQCGVASCVGGVQPYRLGCTFSD